MLHTPLLLPEGQRREAWEPFRKQCSFRNRRALDKEVFSHPVQSVDIIPIQTEYDNVNCNKLSQNSYSIKTEYLLTPAERIIAS